MQKETYYSEWQENDYLATGLNSTTKRECMEDVFDFMMETSEEEIDVDSLSDADLEGYVNGFGVQIHEHEEKLPEEYNDDEEH